jgi:uncharacterized membrane protein
VAWRYPQRALLGTLIGLLFLFPLAPLVGAAAGLTGAALGAADDLGNRDDFRQRAQDLVQPSISAILVVVRKATPDRFLRRSGLAAGPR